ncbi:MAG: zinc-ribbon domain-containing protein, partial [Nanoarchaeota archaeon]|nr:zinc-ribbon domain-containing protein [Nanoarchaeota archaeon]
MGYEGLITFYVLVWMVPCMVIASAKNKSVGKAFLASLLFGLFALIYYIFARSEPKKEEKHTLKCTDCNTEVLDSDKFCPECGAHFDDQEIKCPNCKTNNKGCVKYCTKCGHNLIKEPKLEYQCEYCNKKFKSEETLQNHLEHCKT